ncbi:MAG: SIR2 family protein [Desulfobulbus sp.]|nr:SIR2 family protein [Desulfobulbus sp.]
MQFIPKGPDIPESLLQAHEEGRVVFFCGAGISRPAGLPGFKGLVDDIYKRLDIDRDPIEQKAYKNKQFDVTLGLLERRIHGQRTTVREVLAQALQPKQHPKGTSTHAALLQLARCQDGALRLVTTNCDRIFERVTEDTGQTIQSYTAPMLPVPKSSRWNGLVYLHGLLPQKDDDTTALNSLVITSGDFGLAYLTERWAARFVSELFRNYVVCFVGYSIDDAVLRYMMDALAADRMLGEVTQQPYALCDCQSGQEHIKTIEWKAKGIIPILYEVPPRSRHSALHKTLKAWAESYRDGIRGKELIVVTCALARPSSSTRQDDFVGRMHWALSDASGLPAKRFAERNPVPSLEWLKAFSEKRYRHNDLINFGVSPRGDQDDKLQFSLIRRPAPYKHASWMMLASNGMMSVVNSGHQNEYQAASFCS